MHVKELNEGGPVIVEEEERVSTELLGLSGTKRVVIGVGARLLLYLTLLYNVMRNKIQIEFHWWDPVDQVAWSLSSQMPLIATCSSHRRKGMCRLLLNKMEKMTTPISIKDVHREVKILKALSGHKNLVKFYDACEDALNVYIVMELCEGGELLDRILSRSGRYMEDDAKVIVTQILSVVSFCHLQGVVHRDLKPEGDLAKVNRERTPWLIVILHAPWYNCNWAHQGKENSMRASMEPLLYAASVDILIAGHVHAFERSEHVNNGGLDRYGAVHITIGDGGNREGLARRFHNPKPRWSILCLIYFLITCILT